MSTIREYASGSSYYDDSVWKQNNKSNSFLAGLSVSSEPTAFNYAQIKAYEKRRYIPFSYGVWI